MRLSFDRYPSLTSPTADIDIYHNAVVRTDTVNDYSEFTAFDVRARVERVRLRNNIVHKTEQVDWNYSLRFQDAGVVSETDSDFNLKAVASSQLHGSEARPTT